MPYKLAGSTTAVTMKRLLMPLPLWITKGVTFTITGSDCGNHSSYSGGAVHRPTVQCRPHSGCRMVAQTRGRIFAAVMFSAQGTHDCMFDRDSIEETNRLQCSLLTT